MSEMLDGNAAESVRQLERLAPGLYLVATPIGNLEDITLRALRVLRSADSIACEDTRQTAKLLGHYGIRTPTVSYHLHNESARAQELVEELRGGARIALVSDAGMPGIADPGVAVVAAAIAVGVAVYPIPGANAALAALVASGLETERFTFRGFLPSKAGQRRTVLERVLGELRSCGEDEPATQVFYETPHRVVEALADVVAVFGPEQRVVLARELTKLHEEFLRGTAAGVLTELRARTSIRGEMVLLIEGRAQGTAGGDGSGLTLAEEMAALMLEGASEKDALKQAARTRGLGKSEAYREWQRTKR